MNGMAKHGGMDTHWLALKGSLLVGCGRSKDFVRRSLLAQDFPTFTVRITRTVLLSRLTGYLVIQPRAPSPRPLVELR